MSDFQIQYPRWKQRVVGLAVHRVSDHNTVEILAECKDGTRYYPDKYEISGEEVRKCERQMLPQGVELYLVPISKLTVVGTPFQEAKQRVEKQIEKEVEKQVAMNLDIQTKTKIWR